MGTRRCPDRIQPAEFTEPGYGIRESSAQYQDDPPLRQDVVFPVPFR